MVLKFLSGILRIFVILGRDDMIVLFLEMDMVLVILFLGFLSVVRVVFVVIFFCSWYMFG